MHLTKSDLQRLADIGCHWCHGTGLYAAPNGPDDIDMEICNCVVKQLSNDRELAHELV